MSLTRLFQYARKLELDSLADHRCGGTIPSSHHPIAHSRCTAVLPSEIVESAFGKLASISDPNLTIQRRTASLKGLARFVLCDNCVEPGQIQRLQQKWFRVVAPDLVPHYLSTSAISTPMHDHSVVPWDGSSSSGTSDQNLDGIATNPIESTNDVDEDVLEASSPAFASEFRNRSMALGHAILDFVSSIGSEHEPDSVDDLLPQSPFNSVHAFSEPSSPASDLPESDISMITLDPEPENEPLATPIERHQHSEVNGPAANNQDEELCAICLELLSSTPDTDGDGIASSRWSTIANRDSENIYAQCGTCRKFIHAGCMDAWIGAQVSQDRQARCPCCRADWDDRTQLP